MSGYATQIDSFSPAGRISPEKRASIPRYATSELLEPGRLVRTN